MDLVVLLAARRKHDDGRRRDLFDLRDGRKTVELRHHHIHDNHVEPVGALAAEVHRLHAVFRLGHLVSLKLGVFPDEQPDLRLVVHYENSVHTASLPFSLPLCLSVYTQNVKML